MKISVIIPTYKPKDYLRECLDSLAAQTFAKDEFEVILVLNGCDEPYRSQIGKFIMEHKDDLDIKFMHTLQGGVSNARNMALEQAGGQYICFIDDDDYVSETYLERLYAKADEGTVVISDTYYFEDGKAGVQIPNRMTELFGIMSPEGKADYMKGRRFLFNGCMKLIPSRMIAGRRFDPSFKIGEDCIFMFMISDRLRYVDFTSADAIYYRRVRSDSALHSHTGRWNVFLNDMKLVAGYTRIYLGGLRRYSFHFFLTRLRGALHLI